MKKLGTTKVGQFCKVVIPKSARVLIEVKERDKIDWFYDGENIIVKKAE